MALRVYWYENPRIIEIPLPATEITIQDLTDQIKDLEDEPANLAFPILVKTFGKQPLGAGVYVGITAELQNAKVSFAARDGTDIPPEVLCTISGGNLVAVDENGVPMNPIHPTAYTQVVLAQSSSATIATPPSDYSLLYLVESLRGNHASVGNIWYWDPVSGSDTNDGTTPSNAVQTFAKVQSLSDLANGVNDIVFALVTDPSGITTVTNENINITSSTPGMKLRGPGYAFQFKPATAGSDVITISADNVEVSGFYIQPKSPGSDNGITVTGDSALIKDIWVDTATANGIDISTSSRTKIEKCVIENCTGNGVNLGASTIKSNITTCIISGCVNGVDLGGSGLTDNILENNVIYNNSGYGIDIGAGVLRTGVRMHHTFSNNTSGSYYDEPPTAAKYTFVEEGVATGDINAIVDAVWDEVISPSAHTGAQSAGKTLRDAKTKATLASLK
ncbi:MAG TPA: right-handed parallel beta-helix repeat-containing protein [Patescibacteria group bacterium]|nr:right-handed parallel beta-helix repeat-containing protein [Patescibacteria group bacterium]